MAAQHFRPLHLTPAFHNRYLDAAEVFLSIPAAIINAGLNFCSNSAFTMSQFGQFPPCSFDDTSQNVSRKVAYTSLLDVACMVVASGGSPNGFRSLPQEPSS